jgi:hypothetical protein
MSERLAALALTSILAACAPELRPVSSEDVVFSAPSVRFPFLEVVDGVLYLSASLHKDEVRYPDEDAVIWPREHRGPDHYLSSFVKTPHGVMGTAYITQRRDANSETVFSWLTSDAGRTWQPRVGVLRLTRPQKQRGAKWGGFLMHRSMLRMGDGKICGTAYGGYEDDAKYRSVWVCSADEGANWEVASTIAYSEDVSDEGYGEPVAARIGDGLIAVLRTGRGELRAARSGDGGASWSEPWPIPGTYGAFDPELVVVGDALLLLYGDGSSPVRVRSSHDGGVTWRALPDVTFDTKSSGYVGARVVGDQLLVVTDGHGETALVSKRLPLASLLPSEL